MAVTISFYDRAIQWGLEAGAGAERIDYEAGPIRAKLMTTTHSFTAANETWSQISTNEIASGNGYTTGGTNLASPEVTMPTGGTVEFDAADHSWVASGGSIPTSGTAKYLILHFSGTGTNDDMLVCQVGFGQTESAGTGTKVLITWNANGIYRIS